jgi:hypothetical protein
MSKVLFSNPVGCILARTTEQLRLLVRSLNDLRYERQLHGIEDLPKVHRSLQSRGVSTSLEVLLLTPKYLITEIDVDLQQQKLQGDTFKKEMTS